jgi:predicted nucleic acid-binding protein
MRVVVDTSVLVASMDALDSLHAAGRGMLESITSAGVEVLLLDCVVVETVAVIGRRRSERRRASAATSAFADLFPVSRVTHAYPLLRRRWAEIIAEVDDSAGRLSPHDALILAFARERAVSVISFDGGLRDRGVTIAGTQDEVRALSG